MTVREMQEKREHEYLSPYAAFSDQSKGRSIEEPPCDIRTCFERDRDRIIHSKAFRRLNGKTQVFLTPMGDHYRTRMTHTLEVSQIARTIAKALRLNEDLTEAIALGHDLGHTPFGHAGERALNSVCPGGFEHHLQSIRVVEFIEKKNGKTMNLSWEVKDGIVNHQTEGNPGTLEGKIVRLSDKIAYVNHDIDDATRGHIIEESDIPKEYTDILGNSLSQRLNTLIHDIVANSENKNDIIMSDEIYGAMQNLRKFMFENVYTNPLAKGQEKKAEKMLIDMFEYYMDHFDSIPEEHRNAPEGKERAVCDYIACMTDRYAVSTYNELMVPTGWQVY
ncbi:MAG: deoxyguanosinetriphosphate triphosphohydrolase [Lachnospiraceae bacterium]|nr:deoxyguanosinetriphosphate triphosphohydrolase [Lachnospiraceae bacterium]